MNALKYFGLVSSIAIAAATHPARAQTAKPATTDGRTIPAGQSTRYIRVNNLAPSIIAWWMQPEKQDEPLSFRQSRQNAERYLKSPGTTRVKPSGPVKSLTEMLPGLTAIVPIDAQKAILVIGDEAAIKGVETVVKYLDKPQPEVEIEAQIVEVNATDARAFGIDFTSANGPFTVEITEPALPAANGARPLGFVRGNFQATLSTLVRQSRAKIVSAPRITAMNNLTAILSAADQSSAAVVQGADGRFSIGAQIPQSPASPLLLLSGFELTVTPTINNDDTVTLVLGGGRVLRLQERKSSDSVSLQEMAPITTVGLVHDGGTIMVGGPVTLPATPQSTLPGAAQPPAPKMVTLVFVTARIIRQLDEANEQVPLAAPVTVPNQEWREAMKREAAKRGVGEKVRP